LRGSSEEDLYGGQMARMALQLWNDGEVTTVARYVSSLPAAPGSRTVRGKAKRGRTAYASCAACHGAQAEGNPELGAPPLAAHDDWYVDAFARFGCGTHADDTFGQRATAAALLPTGGRRRHRPYLGTCKPDP
jgi:cytochrome c oxidase subunit 2